LWKTEKEERKEREEKRVLGTANEFTKREVATCLSYIRLVGGWNGRERKGREGPPTSTPNLTVTLTLTLILMLFLPATHPPLLYFLPTRPMFHCRRILQVDSVPLCSKPGEILMAKSIHDKLVVQLRVRYEFLEYQFLLSL
jgi:hypothetical protein